MATYNTTKVKFEILEKKLQRVFKKLDTIQAKYTFRIIREYADDVPVYNIDPITKTQYKVDEIKVDCVEFELAFDTYRVGDFRVGAVLEATTDDGNLIYTVDDSVNYSGYQHQSLRCDHCKINRGRSKAVVLINDNGEQKMVGKTCLKDFIGISVDSFAHYLYGIGEILNDCNLEISDSERGQYKQIIDTIQFLAYCIEITENKGYYRGLAYDAGERYRKKYSIDRKYIDKAKEMAAFFETYETDDQFESNTRLLVTGKTTFATPNGIVAYAPTLYKKIQDRLERERQRKLTAETSDYLGTIGNKITLKVKFEIAGGYETQYGYIRIYKFTDENGNILIWKTSAYIDVADDITEITITGTVSDHSEYNSTKQTILKRVKVA